MQAVFCILRKLAALARDFIGPKFKVEYCICKAPGPPFIISDVVLTVVAARRTEENAFAVYNAVGTNSYLETES